MAKPIMDVENSSALCRLMSMDLPFALASARAAVMTPRESKKTAKT